MALDALRCDHLASLGFKWLRIHRVKYNPCETALRLKNKEETQVSASDEQDDVEAGDDTPRLSTIKYRRRQ